MSRLYRGRLYSVKDIQKLMFYKRYKEELRIYTIETYDYSYFPRDFIEDNLINIANVVLLLAISRCSEDFIDVSEFNLVYDRVLVYINNRDLLGDLKVYNKLMKVAKDLHFEPFVAST